MEENQQQVPESGPASMADGANASPAIPSEVKRSSPQRRISLVLDLAVGVCALIIAGILMAILDRAPLQILLPLTCVVFFAAAATKAVWSQLNPWIEGLAISLGAFFPVAVMAVAIGHARRPEVWLSPLLLAVVCGAGAQAQKLWLARQPLAGVAIAAALLAGLFAGGRLAAPLLVSMELRTMDQPAPPFAVTMLDGTPVTRDSLKGRVVVLDFWGTWCEPCLAEMPTILKVHRQYQGNNGVAFLAVNAEWHDDTATKVRAFIERKHLDVPVALDTEGAGKTLQVTGLPTLVVIDRRGYIRMEDVGYDADQPLEKQLTGEIDELLRQ